MKYRWISVVALATLLAAVAGCSRPETPQQVATEFWRAMAENNTEEAVSLSTLTSTSALDDNGPGRLDTLPDFGRVVIEADQATIVTHLPAEAVAGEEASDPRREITTFLVKVDDQWLVDYQRTHETLDEASPFSGLKSDIEKLREQLDGAVGRSREQIKERMNQLTDELETYSEETGKRAEEWLERFGRSLEDLKKRLEESLDEGSKDQPEAGQDRSDSIRQEAI